MMLKGSYNGNWAATSKPFSTKAFWENAKRNLQKNHCNLQWWWSFSAFSTFSPSAPKLGSTYSAQYIPSTQLTHTVLVDYVMALRRLGITTIVRNVGSQSGIQYWPFLSLAIVTMCMAEGPNNVSRWKTPFITALVCSSSTVCRQLRFLLKMFVVRKISTIFLYVCGRLVPV